MFKNDVDHGAEQEAWMRRSDSMRLRDTEVSSEHPTLSR